MTVRLVIWWVVELKVAQALEMAKKEIKRKREDSIMGGGHKTATLHWNSLQY